MRALPEITDSAVEYHFPGRLRIGHVFGSEEIVLPGGPRVGLDVDRFAFVSGRAAVAPDEIILHSLTAEQTGLGTGALVSFSPYDTSHAVRGETPPTQAGFALAWAAVSANAFSIAIGAPIGVAIGITAWRGIAASIDIAADSVVSWRTLLALLGASLVLSLLISVLSALRAARLRPAEALRGE